MGGSRIAVLADQNKKFHGAVPSDEVVDLSPAECGRLLKLSKTTTKDFSADCWQ